MKRTISGYSGVNYHYVIVYSLRNKYNHVNIRPIINLFLDHDPIPGSYNYRISNTPGLLCAPLKASLEVGVNK